ncbi:MAG TPA: hypothetical protein VKB54_20995 [Solirubrobacteraceae bacterium]|nr:hypothetical protein [Solirubrobacteraceae bacterium]
MRGYLSIAPGQPGAIKQALNASGWLDDEIVAAGELRQGKAPSLLAMATGTALVEVVRPRRTKALPRRFVLAATADRIIAFKAWGGGGGADDGPYIVRVKPGACGSWPRSSVRLVDLPEDAGSDAGTLELDGTERVPVFKPNLNGGDPGTDELIEVLSGRAPSTAVQADLRRAADARPDDYRRLAADAARGRPARDLRGWAERRGLEFRGGTAQGGHLSVTCPWSEDVLFNVVRGRWPGGTYGVVCHEARIYGEEASGFFHGGEALTTGGGLSVLDVVEQVTALPVSWGGSGECYFKVPYTSAGARVPHVAAVKGLHIARRAERWTDTDSLFGTWEARALDDLGLRDEWVAAVRKHSDERAVQRLLRGPIRDVLAAQQGLGFEVRIEYGQVIVSRQDFLERDEDLDALVAASERLAGSVREICAPSSPRSLSTEIEPPEWLASVRRSPRKKHTLWPIGALLERVVQIADERALAVEDPRAFHAAFPGLNFPGEAFGVLRGRLPGTALTGRLLCCAERRMSLPDDFREFLTNPGGAVGSDVAVLAVRSDAPCTAPEGEVDGDVRVAIADGVLTAWRTRESWQADGRALDRLAADVAAIAARRGLA